SPRALPSASIGVFTSAPSISRTLPIYTLLEICLSLDNGFGTPKKTGGNCYPKQFCTDRWTSRAPKFKMSGSVMAAAFLLIVVSRPNAITISLQRLNIVRHLIRLLPCPSTHARQPRAPQGVQLVHTPTSGEVIYETSAPRSRTTNPPAPVPYIPGAIIYETPRARPLHVTQTPTPDVIYSTPRRTPVSYPTRAPAPSLSSTQSRLASGAQNVRAVSLAGRKPGSHATRNAIPSHQTPALNHRAIFVRCDFDPFREDWTPRSS
ncbi:hypothetical protein C8R46DRAFT_1290638, partial [Mycena filopes]